MKTLVVVDVQRDFYHPDGSLYVSGSESLPAGIAAAAEDYDAIIFSLDWHPANHCSFKQYGGIWPAHCVQYTQGAGLSDEFIPILDSTEKQVLVHLKGSDTDREQYGAFEDISEAERRVLDASSEIDVCGIAGDYCVLESVRNLMSCVPAGRIAVIDELVRSIDDGSTLAGFLKNNRIRIK